MQNNSNKNNEKSIGVGVHSTRSFHSLFCETKETGINKNESKIKFCVDGRKEERMIWYPFYISIRISRAYRAQAQTRTQSHIHSHLAMVGSAPFVHIDMRGCIHTFTVNDGKICTLQRDDVELPLNAYVLCIYLSPFCINLLHDFSFILYILLYLSLALPLCFLCACSPSFAHFTSAALVHIVEVCFLCIHLILHFYFQNKKMENNRLYKWLLL